MKAAGMPSDRAGDGPAQRHLMHGDGSASLRPWTPLYTYAAMGGRPANPGSAVVATRLESDFRATGRAVSR